MSLFPYPSPAQSLSWIVFRIYYGIYSFFGSSFVHDEAAIAVDSLAGYSLGPVVAIAASAGPE